MTDVTALTDDELRQVREDVTSESDRRDVLARTPDDVTMLARRYVTAGGDLQILHDAVDAATTEGA